MAAEIKLQQTLERIAGAICQDKELNTPNNLSWPCSICNKNVLQNQKAIQCDNCDKWCHIKCDGTSDVSYNNFIDSEEDIPWNCLYCSIKNNHENFAFTFSDDCELHSSNHHTYF